MIPDKPANHSVTPHKLSSAKAGSLPVRTVAVAVVALAVGLALTYAGLHLMLSNASGVSMQRAGTVICSGMIIVGLAMITQSLRELMPLKVGSRVPPGVPLFAGISGVALIMFSKEFALN